MIRPVSIIAYFLIPGSVLVTTDCCDKTPRPRLLIEKHLCDLVLASYAHHGREITTAGMVLEQELRAHISVHKHEVERINWELCELLKAQSPPTVTYLLQLGHTSQPKYLNIWTCGELSFKPPQVCFCYKNKGKYFQEKFVQFHEIMRNVNHIGKGGVVSPGDWISHHSNLSHQMDAYSVPGTATHFVYSCYSFFNVNPDKTQLFSEWLDSNL